MPNLKKRWQVPPRIPPDTEQALSKYPPILRQILFNRGYPTPEDAERYLEAEPPQGTEAHNMLGVPQAADRLVDAIQSGESIAVYGDYDADGVTATALLVQVLEALGATVQGYIPNRFDEGYGLNFEALDSLHQDGVRLVVTVDCGIRAIDEVEHANRLGLDLIVSDHHHPASSLPPAFAVINPKQPEDEYPEKYLAGVGLAYKLALGLTDTLAARGVGIPGELAPANLLDLVALGTVADMAPLVGENRALVRQGLDSMRAPRRQGLLSLMGAAGVDPQRITSTQIGFVLGPRLNAAGRLDSALAAYRLLTTRDFMEAGKLAQMLDVQNRERQQITREIQAHAEALALAEDPDTLLIFAAHRDFNPGVVGLAASRLTETYYRPSIVAHQGEEFTRASCRSIPEFHITDALDECAELLDHHGGHAAAAGFTVRNERLAELIAKLRGIAQRELADFDLQPTLTADVEVPLVDLRPELLSQLDRLQPTGYGNKQPLFLSHGVQIKHARTVGKDNAHLKLAVSDGWITFDAIAFRQGDWIDAMPKNVDLIYTFERNEFNGRVTLQLNVQDLKPSN